MLANTYQITNVEARASAKIATLAFESILDRIRSRSTNNKDRLVLELTKRLKQLNEYNDETSGHVGSDEEKAEIVSQMIQLGGLREITVGAANRVTTIFESLGVTGDKTAQWGRVSGTLSSQSDLISYISTEIALSDPAYTNQGGVLVDIGGYRKGDVPSGTIKQILNDLFYPFLEPMFSAFSANTTIKEVGDTITGPIPFTWSITNAANVKNAADSGNISANDTVDSPDLGDFNLFGNTNLNLSLDTPYTKNTLFELIFTLIGTDSNDNGIDPITASIIFGIKIYWGSAVGPFLANEAAVKALPSNSIKQSRLGTYGMLGTGYTFICIPQDIAQSSIAFKDPDTGFSYAMALQSVYGGSDTISVTNAFGVTDTYNIYRSPYSIGSSTNLKVE